MTTTAGHSFYIGPIGSFYNQVNDTGSREPLFFYGLEIQDGYHHSTLFNIELCWKIN
jgi:hypothetical protein